MAILLFLLRLIGWVLLAVLLLLLVALLIPLGVRFAYRPGSVRATACYGPLHFTLWPRRGQPESTEKARLRRTARADRAQDGGRRTGVCHRGGQARRKARTDRRPAARGAGKARSAEAC